MWLALFVGGAACGGPQGPGAAGPAAAPRLVDTASMAPAAVLDAVLDECHRLWRGRMDRFAAEVQLPDGGTVRAFARLPDALRIAGKAGSFLLLGETLHRLGDTTLPAPSDRDRAFVAQLRTLLDAAAFGPLHRATACRRTGPHEFELSQPTGAAWSLRLRTGTLLPECLRGPEGEVQLLDYLRTKTTWMVQKASLGDLGVCGIRFDIADLDWAPDLFAPPLQRTAAAGDRPRLALPANGGGEPRSATPVLTDVRALAVVVVEDPGDWPARSRAYRPLHAELERQQQQIAGFPMLWQEEGRRCLGAPFRQRPDGPAFSPPKDWQVRAVPAGKALVVYPPDGDLAGRSAAGESQLRQALTAGALVPLGAIVTQPFFHLHEGEPPPAKLAAPVVRMSVMVR